MASGSNHYSEFYLRECGAVNVAAEIDGQKGVNLEQVYEWDPEVILINNFCPYVPEDFYENKIAGYDWGLVSAVKNKRVYKFPLGIYRWYPPSGDTPLCILWVAQQLHPELFSDVDIAKELRDYYQKFYVYPYLLRGLEITSVNQIWSTDITYIPLRQGYMYLAAVMD